MDHAPTAMNALSRVQLISRENTAITQAVLLLSFAHGGLTELEVQYTEGNILSRLGRSARETACQDNDQAMLRGLNTLLRICRHERFSGKALMTIVFDSGCAAGWTIIRTETIEWSGRKIAMANDF